MDRVIYSKFSNDRSPKFNIITNIVVDEQGKKYAIKQAATGEAIEHIKHMQLSYQKLSEDYMQSKIRFAKAETEKDSIRIDWINGEPFSKYLDRLLAEGREDDCIQLIRDYFKEIFRGETEKVSGIDVDMLFDNMIYENGVWTNYDYEWYQEEDVSIKFMIFRCLLYYITTEERAILLKHGIYEKFGIDEGDKERFTKQEDEFQRYTEGGHVPMWRLYTNMHGRVADIIPYEERSVREHVEQIYFNTGAGFSEKNSKMVRSTEYAKNCYRIMISIPKETIQLRYDPAWCACALYNIRVTDGQENCMSYHTNGYKQGDEKWLFLHDDPQLIVDLDDIKTEHLSIEYEMIIIDSNDTKALQELDEEYAKLKVYAKDRADLLVAREQMANDIEELLKAKLETELTLEQVVQQREKKIQEFEKINLENTQLQEQVEQLQGNLEQLQRTLEERNILIAGMENSLSWKVTKPIRKASEKFRKN